MVVVVAELVLVLVMIRKSNGQQKEVVVKCSTRKRHSISLCLFMAVSCRLCLSSLYNVLCCAQSFFSSFPPLFLSFSSFILFVLHLSFFSFIDMLCVAAYCSVAFCIDSTVCCPHNFSFLPLCDFCSEFSPRSFFLFAFTLSFSFSL